jgi:hypothetical protein
MSRKAIHVNMGDVGRLDQPEGAQTGAGVRSCFLLFIFLIFKEQETRPDPGLLLTFGSWCFHNVRALKTTMHPFVMPQ